MEHKSRADADAKSLESEMRGYKPKRPSGFEFESDDKEKKSSDGKRKLRSISIDKAEGGFTARPEFEPSKSDKKSKEPPMLDYLPKPHIFKTVGEISEFLMEYWD